MENLIPYLLVSLILILIGAKLNSMFHTETNKEIEREKRDKLIADYSLALLSTMYHEILLPEDLMEQAEMYYSAYLKQLERMNNYKVNNDKTK